VTGLGPSGIDDGLDVIERQRAAVAAACAAGHHHYRRDRTAPDDQQWTCRGCGDVAPLQPGVGAPGHGLGWPA